MRFAPPIEEQRKKRRSRWLALALVAVATLVVALLLLRTNGTTAEQGPASTPAPSETSTSAEDSAPTPQPPHPFADIHGWIVYGDYNGIWAIDPTHRGRRKLIRKPIRLSYEPALPVAWSHDGSKLLIVRPFLDEGGTRRVAVSILYADGVEKTVVRMNAFGFASLSPDGSQVVYSWIDDSDPHAGIYLANAESGDVRLLMSPHRRWYSSEKKSFRTELFAEAFAPHGRQIAYVDGMGDWGNSIRVMGTDGSHVRVLVDWRRGPGRQKEAMDNHVYRLAWSPDGSRLAFETDDGIWIVGSDGSGLRMVIRHGHNPTWSPDGSRLAFATWNELGTCCTARFRTADADGSDAQTFAHVDGDADSGWHFGPGPWNPSETDSG